MAHLVGMEVFLDGQPLVVARPTLAGALSTGAETARQRGRVIVEALADGVTLGDDQLSTPSDEPGSAREVRLTSADPRMLVTVTMSDGAEALRSLREEQTEAAQLIQSGREREGVERLSSIIQTWQMIGDLVERAGALLDTDFTALRLDGVAPDGGLATIAPRLAQKLTDMKRALSARDWSRLADILEYDLSEEAGSWEQLLDALARHIGSPPAPNARGA
ncbi:MAG TPA: hypothetical protein VD971_12820 [Phycisphaerales bacterium]|nr:hypothetical protein [Phycisphaerales bacterium]